MIEEMVLATVYRGLRNGGAAAEATCHRIDKENTEVFSPASSPWRWSLVRPMGHRLRVRPLRGPDVDRELRGAGTPVNPYQFKGGLHDRTTNWVKFGHRWYSVEWGRFSQQDTLDAPLDPANANRYAFAANDPINLSDPTGRELTKCDVFGNAIGFGLGTLGGGILRGVFGATTKARELGRQAAVQGGGMSFVDRTTENCESYAGQYNPAPLTPDSSGYIVNPSNGSRFNPGAM